MSLEELEDIEPASTPEALSLDGERIVRRHRITGARTSFWPKPSRTSTSVWPPVGRYTAWRSTRILETLEPKWLEGTDPYEFCLKFVLFDFRVHVANVGMRWPEEVEKNVALVDGFDPPLDITGSQVHHDCL